MTSVPQIFPVRQACTHLGKQLLECHITGKYINFKLSGWEHRREILCRGNFTMIASSVVPCTCHAGSEHDRGIVALEPLLSFGVVVD